jgi:hypothetical protein
MTVGESFLVIGAATFGLYVVWKLAGPAPAGASTAGAPLYPTNTPFAASPPAGLPPLSILPGSGGSPPSGVTPGGTFVPVHIGPADAGSLAANGALPGSNLARALTNGIGSGLIPTPPLVSPFNGPVVYRGGATVVG